MGFKKKHKILLWLLGSLTVGIALFLWVIYISPPTIEDRSALEIPRIKISAEHFSMGNNWLKKNNYGVWEMYVEGNAFERGVIMGHLSKELMGFQEKAFVEELQNLFPSKLFLHFLKYLVAWQNRNLQDYIPLEYQEEIYGLSRFASDEYDYIGPKYQRKLFYHAAHDIGHTVQNMGLVGCSAFSAWNSRTPDGTIISGRNFDFFIGEAFRKNKLLLFLKPDKGYPFASYSWPGMIGVLSGMNAKGLSISLNAGPPELPSNSKTPVSILAREVLQYSSTISEAVEIIQKQETFVSESFLISSAQDGKSIIVEKTPDTTVIVESTNDLLLCTNHFQSEAFQYLDANLEFQLLSSTKRRFNRLQNLITDSLKIEPAIAVELLRDWEEHSPKSFGIGNEENINIMIAHHSIIFQPETKELWISVGLNPMNEFVQYNLDSIFNSSNWGNQESLSSGKVVVSSSWMGTEEHMNYLAYRDLFASIQKGIKEEQAYDTADFDDLIALNSDLYKGYVLAGFYFADLGRCDLSRLYLMNALKKVIPWRKKIEEVQNQLQECQE